MPNLTSKQILEFNKNGYIIIKQFCTKPETNRLLNAAFHRGMISENTLDNENHSNRKSQMPWWNSADDGVLTYLTHNEKIVSPVAQLMDADSPVCHIHAKFIEKKPNDGGFWAWHQDYAWWYANQLLFPDQVMSIAVALTPTNKTTGCSQVIRGSHKLGRLEHGFGNDARPRGADINMVTHALSGMELVHLEMAPGDAVFFHSNLLHRCETNLSRQSCWFATSSYASQKNLETNNTLAVWHEPIKVIPNDAPVERHGFYISELEEISTNVVISEHQAN